MSAIHQVARDQADTLRLLRKIEATQARVEAKVGRLGVVPLRFQEENGAPEWLFSLPFGGQARLQIINGTPDDVELLHDWLAIIQSSLPKVLGGAPQ